MIKSVVKPSVTLLKDINVLKVFTEDELAKLIFRGVNRAFEAHTNIIIESELSWGLYLLLEGTVGIFKTNKFTGDSYDIGQLQNGSFFGEMSLVDENSRSASVRALTDCHLFYISKDSFLEFLNESADLKLRFYETCTRVLVTRLREVGDNYVVSQYQLWKNALKKEAS